MALFRSCIFFMCAMAVALSQPRMLGYKVVPDWPELPAGWNFGEVVSAAADPSGRVLVFHRGPHPIIEFDNGGKFLRSWGEGMISWSTGPTPPSDDLTAVVIQVRDPP